MSEMTDAEFLRSLSYDYDDWTCTACNRLDAIADLIDVMQWRDEPPDTQGDWLRKRDYSFVVFQVKRCEDVHCFPGDRWLKLSEDGNV